MHKEIINSGVATFSIVLNPKIRLEEWYEGSYSVMRGSILYAIPLGLNYTVTAHHYGYEDMSNDYEIRPTTPWNYALEADPTNPDSTLVYHSN